MDPFAGLPPDRAAAIAAWLLTPLCDCRWCGEPVLPTDPRCFDPSAKDDDVPVLLHLTCALEEEQEEDGPIDG